MAESKIKTLSSSGPPFSPSLIEQSLDGSIDELPPGHVPAPGAVISGKYHIDRLIARGGMGVVYAATHNVSGKKLAMKWMLPALGQIKGARERFIREACATARISHPNIVDIYDVGSEQGSVYLVMEFLRGETLSDRIDRMRLNPSEAVAMLMPALRGVSAAHAHGVIHRDLKPDNIFLCCTEQGEELEPKVLDFGISKITSDEVRNLALTHSGAVLGTPYYMSPEQVRGARNVDARTDVYAFGVILFEMLAGQRPFDAETYNELILKIVTEPAPSLSMLNPALDPALVAVVERAMARHPDDRFFNVETLALVLEPFSNGVRFRNTRFPTGRSATSVSGDFPIAHPRVPSPAGGTVRSPSTPGGAIMIAEPVAPPVVASLQPPQPPAAPQRRARSSIVVAALSLLMVCAGASAYLLRPEPVSVARPAPPQPIAPELQPTAALPLPAPNQAKDSETSVNAAITTSVPDSVPLLLPEPVLPTAALPTAPAVAMARSGRPASTNKTNAGGAGNKRGTAYTDRRLELDPPAPESSALTAPTSNKRGLPRDWDERLPLDAARANPLSDSPAGRIDARDFR